MSELINKLEESELNLNYIEIAFKLCFCVAFFKVLQTLAAELIINQSVRLNKGILFQPG